MNIQKTDRLYYDNAYLTDFEARVIAVDGLRAALDVSAFYPTSGGQPFDTGVLRTPDKCVRVTDVNVEDGVVWHTLSEPLEYGTHVKGEIDWPRRFDHMQQHAADHMLAGAAWKLFQGVTIGLHLGHEDSSIDMTLPDGRTALTKEEIELLEDTVNRQIQSDAPIRCWFPDEEELARLLLRKKPTVTEHVRIVAMGDFEMVACGGTHPATTGQIGLIRVLSSTPARGKMRLTFLGGMRAYRYLRHSSNTLNEICTLLSADTQTVLERFVSERDNARNEKKALQESLLQAMLERFGDDRVAAGFFPFAERETLQKMAAELTARPDRIALLAGKGKDGGCCVIFARGREARTDMSQLLRQCGARGGGKPDMAQGSAPSGEIIRIAQNLLSESNG